MATLTSLQGTGGGRIPMRTFSYAVSRHELTALIAAMPTDSCRAMHIATRTGDTATAQCLLREAAVLYFTSTPAAPAAALVAPRRRIRRAAHIPTRCRS